jgi:hypothetical protein
MFINFNNLVLNRNIFCFRGETEVHTHVTQNCNVYLNLDMCNKEKKKLGSVVASGYVNGFLGYDSCKQWRYFSSLLFSPFSLPSSMY